MIRPLITTPEVREAVQKLVEFAAEEVNWYQPGQPLPGDDPRHCIDLSTYRCVFSLTQMPDGSLYRHLSVSVPAKDKLPNPVAFNEIARLFGFPDMDDSLHIGHEVAHNEEEGCIVTAFPVTRAN